MDSESHGISRAVVKQEIDESYHHGGDAEADEADGEEKGFGASAFFGLYGGGFYLGGGWRQAFGLDGLSLMKIGFGG